MHTLYMSHEYKLALLIVFIILRRCEQMSINCQCTNNYQVIPQTIVYTYRHTHTHTHQSVVEYIYMYMYYTTDHVL